MPFAIFGYGLIWAYVDVSKGAQMKTDKIIVVDFDCKSKK